MWCLLLYKIPPLVLSALRSFSGQMGALMTKFVCHMLSLSSWIWIVNIQSLILVKSEIAGIHLAGPQD